ncbi:MAG: hypothetical protein P8M70_07320 [Verrucomicrobiota bacterium]|nr:hypothetical protein [Verrucomicrobiota bacterium]
MADSQESTDGPQEPKYDKLWCWKCRGHTDYRMVIRTHTSEGHTSVREKFYCRGCNKTMHKPQDMDLAFYGKWGRVLIWAYYLMAVLGIYYLAIFFLRKEIQYEEYKLIMGFMTFISLVIPVGVLVRAFIKYATWKKWAQDHGWKEPPAKERAWKNKNS